MVHICAWFIHNKWNKLNEKYVHNWNWIYIDQKEEEVEKKQTKEAAGKGYMKYKRKKDQTSRWTDSQSTKREEKQLRSFPEQIVQLISAYEM